jgi:hypothetical protein
LNPRENTLERGPHLVKKLTIAPVLAAVLRGHLPEVSYFLTMFVRARREGGDLLAGISTRGLVALRAGAPAA